MEKAKTVAYSILDSDANDFLRESARDLLSAITVHEAIHDPDPAALEAAIDALDSGPMEPLRANGLERKFGS